MLPSMPYQVSRHDDVQNEAETGISLTFMHRFRCCGPAVPRCSRQKMCVGVLIPYFISYDHQCVRIFFLPQKFSPGCVPDADILQLYSNFFDPLSRKTVDLQNLIVAQIHNISHKFITCSPQGIECANR